MSTPVIQTPASLLTHSQPSITNANNLLEQSRRAELKTKEDFDNCTDAVKICNNELKRVDEALHKLIDPLTAHVEWIRAQFRPITATIEEAKQNFKDKGLAWKKVEDARLAAEQDELRRKAEEQAIADAEAAQNAGDTARADALLDLAASTPVVTHEVKGRGSYTGASGGVKRVWKGEVEDLREICRAVADNKLPLSVIKEISKTEMNRIANNIKVEGSYHGIKIFEKEDLNVR